MTELDKFKIEFKKWVASKKGKRAIQSALDLSNKISEKFRAARRVDNKLLNTRIDI